MEGSSSFTWFSVARHMTFVNFFSVLVLSGLGFWLCSLIFAMFLMTIPVVCIYSFVVAIMAGQEARARRPKKHGKKASTAATPVSSLRWLWSCVRVWFCSLSLSPSLFVLLPFPRVRIRVHLYAPEPCPSRCAISISPELSFFDSCVD